MAPTDVALKNAPASHGEAPDSLEGGAALPPPADPVVRAEGRDALGPSTEADVLNLRDSNEASPLGVSHALLPALLMPGTTFNALPGDHGRLSPSGHTRSASVSTPRSFVMALPDAAPHSVATVEAEPMSQLAHERENLAKVNAAIQQFVPEQKEVVDNAHLLLRKQKDLLDEIVRAGELQANHANPEEPIQPSAAARQDALSAQAVLNFVEIAQMRLLTASTNALLQSSGPSLAGSSQAGNAAPQGRDAMIGAVSTYHKDILDITGNGGKLVSGNATLGVRETALVVAGDNLQVAQSNLYWNRLATAVSVSALAATAIIAGVTKGR